MTTIAILRYLSWINGLEFCTWLHFHLLMVRTRRNASDTGDPGPGSPVAGLPAVDEGTTGNDPACKLANEFDTRIIIINVPLLSDITYCESCLAKNIRQGFLNLKDIVSHYKEQHSDVEIRLICTSCSKTFAGIKNWNGHRPKCKGVQPLISRPFKCSECEQSFDSQIGLSQHERHMHPKMRNLKRQIDAEKPHGIPGRREYVWSQEETNLLVSLDERFKDSRFPNKEIKAYFPNKTLKQISDKRRCLGNKIVSNLDNVDSYGEGVQGTSGTQVEQSEISGELGSQLNIDEVWRNTIYNYIESIKIPSQSKLANIEASLKTVWTNDRQNPDILFPLLDKIINEEIVPKLLKINVKYKNTESSKYNNEKKKDNNNSQDNNDCNNINKKDKNMNNKCNDNNINKNKNRYINKNNKRNKNHNQRKKFGYARCQELFNKCPKKLAEYTIKGDFSFMNSRQDPPSAEKVKELYSDLWGQTGPQKCDLSIINEHMPPFELGDTIQPITIEEIKNRIMKIKNRSAAGIDGIKKCHLMQTGTVELLTILFNILLVEGFFPTSWKINRTTLIPKPDKDLNEIKNWRPITVGSLLSRTFSAVLDSKLRKFVLQIDQQKGFSNEDGCRFNTVLLKEIINRMKNIDGGIITMIDITKAFDTIPHSMISIGLQRKRVPVYIANYIKKMYHGCKTSIKAADNRNIEVELKRGVKQGDPLSPLLFNLAIEPIIEHLSKETTGISLNNDSVAVLAFADDVVLVAKDATEAQKQINYLNDYLTNIGMSISVSKCATFRIVHKNKTWYIKDPAIHIKDALIKNVEPDQALLYLGTKIYPWSNLKKGNEVPTIVKIIKNVRRLYLKPYQKIGLIQTFILPHFIYSLTINAPSKGTLKMLDSEIRQHIKEILRLPISTTNGFFYTPKKDGGLGFIKFQNLVPLAAIKNSIKMQQSKDPVIRTIVDGDNMKERVASYCSELKINMPESVKEIDKIKSLLKNRETSSWEELQLQGQGVKEYRGDKIGNKWLMDPTLLKSSRFLDAIRLRTNTFGTRVVLSKTKPNAIITCRKCSLQAETLGHILGICTYTKPARIKRHNDIRDYLANKISKTKTVFIEPTVNENGELKKPDLVIKNKEKIQVIDVTIRYEDKNYLKIAAEEKIEKYKTTAELLQNTMKAKTSEVLPVVIGSRGTIPKDTKLNLKKLGFNQKDMLTISLMTLRSSIEIANAFIDYD